MAGEQEAAVGVQAGQLEAAVGVQAGQLDQGPEGQQGPELEERQD